MQAFYSLYFTAVSAYIGKLNTVVAYSFSLELKQKLMSWILFLISIRPKPPTATKLARRAEKWGLRRRASAEGGE